MLVTALLGKAGHRVDVVANGLEAVRAVQAAPDDLVLMEVQIPEMDGSTATKEIRQLPNNVRDIPVIALTAIAMVGQGEEYPAAGMNDCVSKPIARACGHGSNWRAKPRVECLIRKSFRCMMKRPWIGCGMRSGMRYLTRCCKWFQRCHA